MLIIVMYVHDILCVYCSLDQRNLGMSMKVEASTLDQVKQRFQKNKEKLTEEKKQYGWSIITVCIVTRGSLKI